MRQASLDFETRSACDLINEGAYRYASDPTTDVICCSYSVDGRSIYTWWPQWVTAAIGREPDSVPAFDQYTAWNSQFDRLIWQYICESDYGFTKTEIEDWICTSALARANGLPGKLENAALALKLPHLKDKRGAELIKLLSIPNGGTRWQPTFNEDPDLLREMIQYCEQDVRVEYGMLQMMRPFLPHELREFHANERINDRGVGADTAFAAKAVEYGDIERNVLENQLQEVTAGEVERPTQYQRVKNWLLHGWIEYTDEEDGQGNRFQADPHDMQRINEEALKQMTIYKGGERKISLDKAVRHNLLELYDEDPRILTAEALEVIQLTDLANKSSVAKYRTILKREIDGRVFGSYVFNGAMSTGRFSAHGLQLHNMVRDVVDDFDAALEGLAQQEDTEAIHTLAKMMRPTIIAGEGNWLFWSDWSNIEGRVLPWLANTPGSELKLDMFREQDANPDDPDVYERMAERMRLKDRQTGKVAELSMGFGGGVGAFQAMARNYGVRVSDALAKDVQKKWRVANPWAEPFWYQLKDAAWNAIARPGEMFKAGRVVYFYTPGTHNGLGTLWCQLPSKRLLSYVNPRFERVPTPWNPEEKMTELTAIKANFKPKAGETEWPRYKLWYGVLAENVTQAVAADLLRDKLPDFEEADIPIVAHTHDEVIAESDEDVRADMHAIMVAHTAWSHGLPIAADMEFGRRYKMKIAA